MPGHIEMWAVYDHPSDHPSCFIARKLVIYSTGATVMTHDIITSNKLKEIRRDLRAMGLVPIARMEQDDPVIVETWL